MSNRFGICSANCAPYNTDTFMFDFRVLKIFYLPNKHGIRINYEYNQNNTITKQTKTLEARFKFRFSFGHFYRAKQLY